MLDAMTDKQSRIQVTKAARDKIDDSFWDNTDLELSREHGQTRFEQYEIKASEHIAELTALMNLVSSDQRLAMLAQKKQGN